MTWSNCPFPQPWTNEVLAVAPSHGAKRPIPASGRAFRSRWAHHDGVGMMTPGHGTVELRSKRTSQSREKSRRSTCQAVATGTAPPPVNSRSPHSKAVRGFPSNVPPSCTCCDTEGSRPILFSRTSVVSTPDVGEDSVRFLEFFLGLGRLDASQSVIQSIQPSTARSL